MELGSRTIAVVTGAANGIGRALSLELARRGVAIALIDIDAAALRSAAAGVPRCSSHVCDVADFEALQSAAQAVIAAHGAVHLLLNNAGISVAGPIERLTLADFHAAMDVNFWGVVHGCQAFLPHLRAARERGEAAAVCTVLGDFALCSFPTKAPYAAAKHAARALMDALAAELHGTGIGVTAVYPGATATALVRNARAVDAAKRAREDAFLARGMSPERVARKIVNAIVRDKARALIGLDSHALDIVSRLS